MKQLYFLYIFLFFICGTLAAQQRIITGKVIDAKTKQPLSSSSVYALHSGNGVITDEDGSYTLTISNRINSIPISMFEYTPVIKPVSKGKNQIINFEVQPAAGSMSEVSVSAKSKYTRANVWLDL